MNTTYSQNISPVDALWVLYKSQTKKVREELFKRIVNERVSANAPTAATKGATKTFADSQYTTLKSREEINRWFESL